MKNQRIEQMIPDGVKSVLLLGHIRPDGDCVGSTMGLYHYLKTVCPELSITVCLQPFSDSFVFIKEIDQVIPMDEMDMTRVFDLCISCDASDRNRLGDAVALFDLAKHRITIDHHITNTGMAEVNYIRGGLSSCSEAICELIDMEKVNLACAECLYLGLVHDTGVFRFNTTTLATMTFAGQLMEKGVDQNRIIDDTYFSRKYAQTLVTGYGMEQAKLALNGKAIYSFVSKEDMKRCGADSRDLNGIIDELRVCQGVEAAVFIYELDDNRLKASLRSNGDVDVSRICASFGGGGHVRAAGCDTSLPYEEFLSQILAQIQEQL